MRKRDPILAEFCIRVFGSGKIDWDGADEFLRRRLLQRPKDFRAFKREVLSMRSRRRHGGW
jgi:hypothetical protein